MHRIDTPSAQTDKFGAGKNGFTNGDPGTGRRATDLNSDMWDAVQEEICAVIEKSGLALNKGMHDQLYQAIVKIITSKIPDALLKKNNLSDVLDKAVARNNIGLKGAAVLDVGTGANTVAAGNDSRIVNAVPNTRKINGHALNTDANLTAGDVGALPSGGGRLTGNLEIYGAAPIIQLTETDTGKKYFVVVDGNGFRINEDTTAGNAVLTYVGGSKILTSIGQIVPGNYANFDTKYQPKGSYTPAGEAYTKAVSDTRFQPKGSYTPAGEAYTKAVSDGRFQPKGSYTPAGQAYTKAESDSRFGIVSGVRRSGQQIYNSVQNWIANWEAPPGCVVTGFKADGAPDGRRMGVFYRQMQYLNKQTGAWVNIGD